MELKGINYICTSEETLMVPTDEDIVKNDVADVNLVYNEVTEEVVG